MRSQIMQRTEQFGKAFEHLLFLELKAFLDYSKDRRPFTFYRDYSGKEIDFIVGDDVAIEAKATELVIDRHLKPMKLIGSELNFKRKIIVSFDTSKRVVDDIEIIPWRDFLSDLWNKKIL